MLFRSLMRDFVQRQKQAREYDGFLNNKVAQARAEIEAGNYSTSDAVESRFSEHRSKLQEKVDDSHSSESFGPLLQKKTDYTFLSS